MTQDVRQSILAAFPSVDVAQLSVTQDGSAVKMGLREDQLATVLRENGRYVRELAMATGIRIDVELAKSNESNPWWKFWRQKEAQPGGRQLRRFAPPCLTFNVSQAMRRILLLLAIAVLLPGAVRATSVLADPTRKDLGGVWVGEVDDRPIVIDLRLSGFSHWVILSDDGRVTKYPFTWLCLAHGELRFQLKDGDRAFFLPIEGALANRNSWEKLTILCGPSDSKAEKRKIEFRRLSTAERKLGPLLVAIEQAEKKMANQMPEPTPNGVTHR